MRVVTPDLITFLTLCSAVWFACRGTIPCQEALHRTAALQSDNSELKTTTTTTTQWLHPPRPPGCWSSLRRRGSWWSCSRWQWRMTRTCPGGQKTIISIAIYFQMSYFWYWRTQSMYYSSFWRIWRYVESWMEIETELQRGGEEDRWI